MDSIVLFKTPLVLIIFIIGVVSLLTLIWIKKYRFIFYIISALSLIAIFILLLFNDASLTEVATWSSIYLIVYLLTLRRNKDEL